MSQAFLFLAISIVFTASAQLLLKKGMLLVGQLDFSLANLLSLFPRLFQNGYLFFGLVSFGAAFFSWLFVLSKIQLNIAYPVITSVNFGLVILGSWFLFKEELSLLQIFGIGVIIFGIFLLLK